MKIVWSRYGLEVTMRENQINTIVLEDPSAFLQFMQTVLQQLEGEEGDLILAEGDKILPFSKNIIMIDNPLTINCNEKKILTKLYKELENIVNMELCEKYSTVNTDVVQFMESVMNAVPYHLEMDYQIGVGDLLKVYNVKIATEELDPVERLIDYLRAIHTICNINIVLVLNLKQFYTLEQVQQIYEFCFYEKIFLINVEGIKSYLTKEEKCAIIDKDLCLIYSDND